MLKNNVIGLAGDRHSSVTVKVESENGAQSEQSFSPSVKSSVGAALRKERDDWIDFSTSDEQVALESTQQDFAGMTAAFVDIFSRHRFEFLYIFNGRFHDVAAAIEAARQLHIPFATHERAWFGRGLQINLNADCLSLRYGHHEEVRYSDADLDVAKNLIASRISNGIKGEWKGYSQSRESLDIQSVPQEYRGKHLVVPSSRSEFLGHSDFELVNENSLATLDAFLEFYKICAQDVIVRGHPAWVSKVGSKSISDSAREYREWCVKNGATFIEPDDHSVSTYELMVASKLGVFNGGSAVVEAIHLGLPCVLLSKSHYAKASFVTNLSVAKELWPTSLPQKVQDSDLKDVYKYVSFRYRHQVAFFNNVVADGPTKYSFKIDDACLNEFDYLISIGKSGICSDAAYNIMKDST